MIELLVLPLLMLNNLTLDDFSTSAEWVESPDILSTRHYYQWRSSQKSSDQYNKIYSQSYWGLPKDTVLQSGVGPVQWFYLHTTGPKYELYYDNQSYSNSSELRVISGYLPKPKKNINRISINSVSFSPIVYQYNEEVVTIKTTVTVKWEKRIKRALLPGFKTKYYSDDKELSTTYKNTTLLWQDLEAYNQIIPATVTNHSSAYTTININIPDGCSHYTITATSENNSAHYIKTNYVYHKLYENCYYVESFETLDHAGMRPFGKNTFLLQNDEYDVKMYASSPFENTELNLNVSHIDEYKEKRELNKYYFTAMLTLIITGLMVKKYYGSY